MSSRPFTVWIKAVSGRIESNIRVTNSSFNSFPFPKLEHNHVEKIREFSEAVLSARDAHPDSTMADLYSPNSMPTALRQAHNHLDNAVLKAFGLRSNARPEAILAELFKRYDELTTSFE